MTLAVAVLVCLSGACTASNNNLGTQTPGTAKQTPTPGSTSGAPTGTAVVNCELNTVVGVVYKQFPNADVADRTCAVSSGQAAATLIEPNAADRVVLFASVDGRLAIVAVGPVDRDPATLLPKDFSMQVYRDWREKYEARLNPPPPPPSDPNATYNTVPGAEGGAWCHRKGEDGYECRDPNPTTTTIPTTLPPSSTTTVTTLPAVTVPTTPATTQPPVSAYCNTHPLDRNCLANPSFPG